MHFEIDTIMFKPNSKEFGEACLTITETVSPLKKISVMVTKNFNKIGNMIKPDYIVTVIMYLTKTMRL